MTIKLKFLKGIKQRITVPRLMMLVMSGVLLLPLTGLADTNHSWGLPVGSGGLTSGGGDISNMKEAVAFYDYFHNYLTPHMGIFAIASSTIGGGIAQGVAHLVDGLQTVFYSTINLMSIFNDLSNSNTKLGLFFSTTQKLGVIIFGLSIVIYAVFVIFNGKSKVFRSILQTVFLATLVVSFIPWMLGQTVTFTKDSIDDTAKATNQQSIALSLIQNNVVDKYVMNSMNWEVNLNSDGTVSDPSKYNIITSIDGWNPAEMAGVITDTPTLTGLDKGTSENDAKAVVIFEHELTTLPKHAELNGKVESETKVSNITYHKAIGGMNYFEDNYLRYKVNWLPLFLSELAVAFLFVTMSIKVVLSITQITLTTIAAPVLAAIKARHVKKVKELIAGIFHGVAGIYFDFLIVGVAVAIMAWITTTTVFTDAGIPGLAVSLLKTATYIGVFFGVFAGVGVVEKFLGVSSGHGNALKQILAAGMITRGVMGMAGAGMGIGKAFGQGLASNFKEAKNWWAENQNKQLQMMPQLSTAGAGAGGNSTVPNSGQYQPQTGLNGNSSAAPQNQAASQRNSNRQEDAQKTLEKQQQKQNQAGKEPLNSTPIDTKSADSKQGEAPFPVSQGEEKSNPTDSQQPLQEQQPFEPLQGGQSPIQPEKTRKEKAMERRAQQQRRNQSIPPTQPNYAKDEQEGLEQQAPQQYSQAQHGAQDESQQNVELPTHQRVQRLEERLDTAEVQKREELKAQKKAEERQKRSARIQKASQNLSQGFQNMQQIEPHIGSAEDED